MESKVNKEIVSLFFNKLSKLFKYFFPGILVLELFFNQGFFSNSPNNLISLFLFLFWCGILSLPFHFVQPSSIDDFKDNIIDLICKKHKIDKEKLEEFIDVDDNNAEEWEDAEEEFELGFILIKLLMTYLTFKFLLYFQIPSIEFLHIPINILQLFFTMITIFIFSYPMGYIYSKIFERIILHKSNKWF